MTEMPRFARLLPNGTVAEILTLPADALADMFHPDIVAALRPVAEDVMEGWRHVAGAWSAPGPDLDAMAAALRALPFGGQHLVKQMQVLRHLLSQHTVTGRGQHQTAA